MRIESLTIGDDIYKGNNAINYLHGSNFDWLLECEIDNAVLEIINNTLIWKSGIFYWGIFEWGIFESGDFRSGKINGGIIKEQVNINNKVNIDKVLKIK